MAAPPRLLLFARAPQLGRVKTRLEPVLGRVGCLRLYRAFLTDAARAYLDPRWESVLMAEPDPEDPEISPMFPHPWKRAAQASGDLGARLAAAFGRVFADGSPEAVAVGSDHPLLSRARLAEALAAARVGGAALVPATDGGYCAIALSSRVPLPEVFSGIPWSTERVLRATRDRLSGCGISPAELPPSYDVDRPADLERLKRDLERLDPAAPGFPTATARALCEIEARERA